MNKPRLIKIAGPMDDQQTGTFVEAARTQFFVRERVADAVRQALPPHARRPMKGSGRWSGHLSAGL